MIPAGLSEDTSKFVGLNIIVARRAYLHEIH